jgi:UV DNA damage endonuclease
VRATVRQNLSCLFQTLKFNAREEILFFRITSDLVPFASHPVCTFPWQEYFRSELEMLGRFIRENRMRISMHPDQFVLINSPDTAIVQRSVADLTYHAEVLDLMGLDNSAKIQIHVGGAYGDKKRSIGKFGKIYETLAPAIRNRLVIENDDRSYTARDCLEVHELTGIPVIFDTFHHNLNRSGDPEDLLLPHIFGTWKTKDGIPMTDYSSQEAGRRRGAHAEHIDIQDFRHFIEVTRPYELDIMLEIKDKEKSAREAIILVREDPRLNA